MREHAGCGPERVPVVPRLPRGLLHASDEHNQALHAGAIQPRAEHLPEYHLDCHLRHAAREARADESRSAVDARDVSNS